MPRLSGALIHQQKQIGRLWHSLHPRPKPCGVCDICQILLDQRMTITQTGVHIPPTAALKGSWPLSTGQVKKHRWDEGHTYVSTLKHPQHWSFTSSVLMLWKKSTSRGALEVGYCKVYEKSNTIICLQSCIHHKCHKLGAYFLLLIGIFLLWKVFIMLRITEWRKWSRSRRSSLEGLLLRWAWILVVWPDSACLWIHRFSSFIKPWE